MLFKNYSKKTVILYDKSDKKYEIHPEGKIDDSVLPQIKEMKAFFIPIGMKRNPKRKWQ